MHNTPEQILDIKTNSEVGFLFALDKLNKDLREATRRLSTQEARFLVDMYYQVQDFRIAADGRTRALGESKEPNIFMGHIGIMFSTIEKQIKYALGGYVMDHKVGARLIKVCGIGPVIGAGLLAYIDIHKANTAGKIWSYAGLEKGGGGRKKGEKLKHNPDLKRLCWLLGECFVKVKGRDNAFYGKLYDQRKAYEQKKNEAGDYADQAKSILETKTFNKDTEAYKAYIQGKLPPGHIHARAKRYAVKMLLAHLQEVWYEAEFGVKAPVPYVIEHMGHVDYIPPQF